LKRLIEESVSDVPHAFIHKNPYFPDLLNQPEVLVVPEVGRLIAIYLYTPRQRLTWRTVLPAIEDLFEIKIAVGKSVVAAAVLEATQDAPEDDNLLQLMAEMFDIFLPIRDEGDLSVDSLPNRVRRTGGNAAAKERFFDLWQLEKQRSAEHSRRFSEETYAQFVDERQVPTATRDELIESFRNTADGPGLGGLVRYHYRVRTPKEPLAGLPERNRFVFDIAISRDWQRDPVKAIDVVSLGRYGSRPKLRYLMTKARFTSYELQGQNLQYRANPVRPVLLLDGNIAGPSHDPYRYLRALLSVGWEIDRAEPEALLRLANADF
jgi:hypothetical protein